MPRPEFELIDWIRQQIHDRPPVSLGIGDDAALLSAPTGEILVATDMLMEGVHFEFPDATPQLAGRKALAVNLSDIAAMGGKPTAAFVSICLPRQRGVAFARDVHSGVIELANEFGVVIAGGDTNSWTGPLVISVTVTGHLLGASPIRRSDAQPGDWIFVTGKLGGSLASGRHLTFVPRVNEVQALLKLVTPHSMIDVSDGLAADLHHILNGSHVGATLDATAIPITETALSASDGKSSLLHGLSDGEDFELLFTTSPEEGRHLQSVWNGPTLISRIGEIDSMAGCRLRQADGSIEELPPLGWTHSLGTGS